MRADRRTLGVAMIAIGCAGIVASIAGVVVGQRVVGQVDDSVDDTLVLTADALTAANDSVAVTRSILDTLRSSVVTVTATIDTLQTSIDDSASVVGDVGVLSGGALPDTLEAIGQLMPAIESTAASIDATLRALSAAPFGPDYDPAVPFDAAIGDVADAIGPLPEQLRALSARLEELSGSSEDISAALTSMRANLTTLDEQLVDVGAILDRYAATAADAEALARRSRDDLGASVTAARVMLVVLALVFASGQIVPIWLGRQLMSGGVDPASVSDTPVTAGDRDTGDALSHGRS